MPSIGFKSSQMSIAGVSKTFLMQRDVNKFFNRVKLTRNEILDKKNTLRAAQYVRDTMADTITSLQVPAGGYYTYFSTWKGKTVKKYRPEVVYRYRNGKVVAGYKIGNLARSIKILRHMRKSKDTFVGPRYWRGSSSSYNYFGTKGKVDPWYAHIVNNGTSSRNGMFFIELTVMRTRNRAVEMMKKDARRTLKKAARKFDIAA